MEEARQQSAGDRHLEIVDRSAAPALAVAIPHASVGIDAEVIVFAPMDTAASVPFRTVLFHFFRAGLPIFAKVDIYFTQVTPTVCGRPSQDNRQAGDSRWPPGIEIY